MDEDTVPSHRATTETAGRDGRADLWEAAADERERLANERERLADEREALADERERLADRLDRALDRQSTDDETRASARDPDDDAEIADADVAVRRAEAAVRRAEAEVLRARQTAARTGARAARRVAGEERAAASAVAHDLHDDEEQAWMLDRRDFVAAERDALADERDVTADERDETALLRERLADRREHESLNRERRLDERNHAGSREALRRATAADRPDQELRARTDDMRERAAAGRRLAAGDRSRAADRWRPQAYGPMLLASFGQLAQEMFGSEATSDVLPRVLKYAVEAVTGCDWASVVLWRREQVVDSVITDAIAADLDDVQFGTGLGPAPEALQSRYAVVASHLAEAPQWPVLAAVAAQNGVGSALCHGLFVHDPARWSALGTLNLYGAAPDAFGDEDQGFVSVLASYVSVAVGLAQRGTEVERREAALHRAMSTRDVIGQAKGILMERQRLSAGAAFDVLRQASQRLNRKLSEVAQHLTETGELPS
jgi:hypothetical protein